MKKLMILFVISLFCFININSAAAAENEVIKLPEPQKEGGMPLMKALSLRKSTRGNFGPDTELSMQQISNLLWAADGINRPGTNYRTAPSAGGLQNTDIYVTTVNGYYLYDPATHSLMVLGKEDIRAVSGQQPFVTEAPVNLIYVVDYAKAVFQGQKLDQRMAETWAYANAAAIGQNVYLWCASEGLACIIRAMADGEAISKTLKLRPDQQFILAQTIAHFKK